MALLTVNAGSSSLKVSVFNRANLHTPFATLSLEEIGTKIASPEAAAEQVQSWLNNELSIAPADIEAVGHRVVHGGNKYASAVGITPDVVSYLESITPLAPNHMPATLHSMRTFTDAYPEARHVACFDTSFFHDIPAVAKTLPIPLSLQKELTIRRYGFHGLSYQSLLASFEEIEGTVAKHGRVVMCHLGSGASVAATKNALPIDMSMGFTPVSGIMMSTRSGDLEPGLITYLEKERGLSSDELSELFTKKSGVLGVSETTADMHEILLTQDQNPQVKLALELFCYKITKQIGAYAAALGGIDSLIFSGGIGERSAEIRARICRNLQFLGIDIDPERNERGERCISTDSAHTGVHVIPAREDYSIITQTIEVLDKELRG